MLTNTSSAEVISKILLIQSMIGQLAEEEQVKSFVAQGLLDIPGIKDITYSDSDEKLDNRIAIPIIYKDHGYGSFYISVENSSQFNQYFPHIQNLISMVALFFEERRQRLDNKKYQESLEELVEERTKKLYAEIEERKKAEYKAIEEKRLTNTYLNVSKLIVIELDCKAVVTSANRWALEMLGYESNAVIGKNWFDLTILPQERDAVYDVFIQMMSGNMDFIEMYENQITDIHGETHHIVWHNTIKKDRDEEVVGTISAGMDITERIKAEADLKKEKELLSVTLRSIADGVITTDKEGIVLSVNKVAENLIGCTHSSPCIGKPVTSCLQLSDELTGEPIETLVKDVCTTLHIVERNHNLLLETLNGEVLSVSICASPLLNSRSMIVGTVIVFRDITEQKRISEKMTRTDRLDSLGVLAGGIAHDFNNLLSGLFGYVELAKDNIPPNSLASEYLEEALSIFDRTRSLTQQLLTFSKGGEPNRTLMCLNDVIVKNVNFALSGSQVSCDFFIDESLCFAEIDENQIGQVIDNLIINAKQAMDGNGKIRVTAQNCRTIPNDSSNGTIEKDYVKISVEDFGSGIPEHLLEKIFDPFITTKATGNGLGLSTCYSIIKKHEGWIDVISTEGKGTTFTIYIQATKSELVQSDTNTEKKYGRGVVVIMDDEKFILDITSKILTSMGFFVITSKDGDECISKCRKIKTETVTPVAILLDLTIPNGKGGEEITETISDVFPEVPIIAVSGYSNSLTMSHPTRYGFSESIRKPFLKKELEALLEKYE